MGIRISMSLILGVDDLKMDGFEIVDPRWKAEQGWRDGTFEIPKLQGRSDLKNQSISQQELWIAQNRDAVFLQSAITTLVYDFLESGRVPNYQIIQHDPEYGVKNVLGVVVKKLPYADDVLYALASLYPEFQGRGYKVLPSIPLEDDDSLSAIMIRFGLPSDETSGKQRLINANQNYPYFTMMIGGWLDGAEYILKEHLQFDVKRDDLKLMLYWQWS